MISLLAWKRNQAFVSLASFDNKNKISDMHSVSLWSISEKSTKFTLFLFFSLLVLSVGFFVFADDTASTKNIFQDSDQDGLSNDEEKLYGTDPFNKDTDGDGYSDGVEVMSGYDPLKPAPGDKIIKENTIPPVTSQGGTENLTKKVSGEIVGILKNTTNNAQAVSMEDINTSVEKALSGNTDEVTLPDINIKDIKIKKLPKNLGKDKKKEQEQQDILEYLTVTSYIIANNSPQTFHTEDELVGLVTSLSTQTINDMATGNVKQLSSLSATGKKILEQLKDVEVPEAMLDLHVKGLKMATYATQLDKDLKINPADPLGQISEFSKLQGFLGVVSDYFTELTAKLAEYNISNVPIEL